MENIKSIHLDGMKEQIAMNIIGNHDRNLIVLSSQFEKDISYRDNTFFVRNCRAYQAYFSSANDACRAE